MSIRPLLSREEMQAAEEALFAAGVEAEHLMEAVGGRMTRIIDRYFPRPGTVIAYVGTGHNGGDALVVARLLGELGWEVFIRLVSDLENLKPLTQQKLEEVGEYGTQWDSDSRLLPEDPRPLVLLDGLLGIGARGALRPEYREASAEMNALRLAEQGATFALDIPSGVDANTGEVFEDAVVSDFTLTVGYAKPGLVADAAIDHVGRLAIVPLPEVEAMPGLGDRSRMVVTGETAGACLPRRRFSTHKGEAGRVAIIAGSAGFTGAPVLCASGALRGGAGLVTLFVPNEVHSIVASKTPPEVMVKGFGVPEEIDLSDFDAAGVGPGIGTDDTAKTIFEIALAFKGPLVIDADALTILAYMDSKILTDPLYPRLLTPHPGEMGRLLGEKLTAQHDRADLAKDFVDRHAVTLLFKGSRTIVAEQEKPLAFNSTGHPGMATGGVGDVLTGLCAALIGQGLTTYDVACAGSWLIGRAAEEALRNGWLAQESFVAGDVAENLGRAFSSARSVLD